MDNVELIIFDCDGVLVDSERIANEVYAKTLEELCGLSFSLEQMYEIFVGKSSQQCLQIIQDMLGKSPPKELQSRCKHNIDQALNQSVTAVNGIEHALNNLPIPYCVASNSTHERINISLRKTNLLHLFKNKIYSVSDVARAKPFPDIYLYAARKMGHVNPNKCLVIEDSPTGVRSAVAAGMTVFGYTEIMPSSRLIEAGAHRTFKAMNKLQYEIKNYSKF